MLTVDSNMLILGAQFSASCFPQTQIRQRIYSAQVIIYSVYSEMGKHLPGAVLNLKNW